MSGWQASNIGNSAVALSSSNELMHAFSAYDMTVMGKIPAGFCVFARYDIETDQVTWYFSPEAADFARRFGGEPSEKPIPSEGFGLQVGAAESLAIHFPELSRRRRTGRD